MLFRPCSQSATAAFLAWVLMGLIVLLVPVDGARAASLEDFHRAVEDAAAHNRVALGYLRTGNVELSQLELERLQAAWRAFADKFGSDRPDVFDQKLYTETLTDISLKIVTADMLLKSGRAEGAQSALAGVRDALSNLRRSAHVMVLADCIADANVAMTTLGDFDKRPIDWIAKGGDIASATAHYQQTLSRCDTMAPDKVKTSDEFRRLVDGAQLSLTLIAKAAEMKDGDMFHRIVIELRSFDNLMAFRFG